jgi:hypothetical protein
MANTRSIGNYSSLCYKLLAHLSLILLFVRVPNNGKLDVELGVKIKGNTHRKQQRVLLKFE